MARYSRIGTKRYPQNSGGLEMILIVLFNMGTGICSTWAIIEFILYLVKDKEFNWTSVWLAGICLFLTLFFFIRRFIRDP